MRCDTHVQTGEYLGKIYSSRDKNYSVKTVFSHTNLYNNLTITQITICSIYGDHSGVATTIYIITNNTKAAI